MTEKKITPPYKIEGNVYFYQSPDGKLKFTITKTETGFYKFDGDGVVINDEYTFMIPPPDWCSYQ